MKHKRTTELRYPGLWRGCVGAWAPCLGPTGLTLRDLSGNRNNGTSINTDPATAWLISQGKHAFKLDGVNDYIQTPTTTSLDLNGPWAMALWVKINSATGGCHFLSRNTPGGAVDWAILYGFGATGAAQFYSDAPTGFGYSLTNSNVTLVNDVWAHIGYSYDGTTYRAFKDGIVLSSVTGAGVVPRTANSHLNIGSYNAGRYMNGIIDDVRIYKRAITPNEIVQLASRRGIAYDLSPRRRSRVFGGFKAAWAARKAQIIGGGL